MVRLLVAQELSLDFLVRYSLTGVKFTQSFLHLFPEVKLVNSLLDGHVVRQTLDDFKNALFVGHGIVCMNKRP